MIDQTLPIAAVAQQVCDALQQGNVVLQAQPGAGKSTALPLALLDAGFKGKILLLEPRRLAAQNVAARLASQLGERLGETVGLRMRGRTEVSSQTRLEVVTEGVLTRILQNDPTLDGISLVILDEFHERSLHADLGLALCLDVQQALRDDLRLLLMSATLDGDQLCSHVQAAAPIVCEVRQHPVDIIWQGESRDPLQQAVAKTVKQALAEHSGDVLVFLPGVAEIERTARVLSSGLPDGTVLHRLHGGASSAAQRAATAAKGTERRVILSTSIAETSITIDGVRVVIDTGLERRSTLDAHGVERLETVMASQASATQRAGRAGRTEAGVCYRLWSESGHSRRAERWQPEIERADLSALLLELGQWGIADVHSLQWVDTPPTASVDRARDLLQRFGMWSSEGVTAYGRTAAVVSAPPRMAHMLLWANAHGAATEAAELAAMFEERPKQQGVDLLTPLRKPSQAQSKRAAQLKKQLPTSNKTVAIKPSYAALLMQAFPDRIAQLRPGAQDVRYLLSGGFGAVLHADDSLAQSPLLVVGDLGGAGKEARIFSALALQASELEEWGEDLLEELEVVDWDERNARVVAEWRRSVGAVILESKPLQEINPEQRSQALMLGVRKKGLDVLGWTEEAREWQARVRRMRIAEGESTSFPSVDDASLLESLEHWLLPYAGTKTTLKALAQIDLLEVLGALLDYSQQQQLESWFPTRYTVPSGSSYKLRYACEGNPVLAVKLQEMFGCKENPAVANGRLPLKVELLSPARRPIQITEDLANFWHNSYAAVKKDMAGRYPKHPWPDDPANAEPTARAKPRKR